MPRSCTVCGHERRDQIDAAILGGHSMAAIAETFRIGEDAAQRHKVRHLSAAALTGQPPAAGAYSHKPENRGIAACNTPLGVSTESVHSPAPAEVQHVTRNTAVVTDEPPAFLCPCGLTDWARTSGGRWACRHCGGAADERFARLGRDLRDCAHPRRWQQADGSLRCDTCGTVLFPQIRSDAAR